MKKILSLAALLFVFSISAIAQKSVPYGHLTIISEDGEPFYLYVNNVKYNRNAVEVVRIENLTDIAYNIKVEFQNKRLISISQRDLRVADEAGYMQDITYSISSNRRGLKAFMLYSVFPMSQIYIDPNNIDVYTLGKANVRRSIDNNYRTRWNTGREDYRGGKDPRTMDRNKRVDAIPPCPLMPEKDFTTALNMISKESFESNRLSTAKVIIASYCLSTDQITEIIKKFSFESTKLEYAQYAYPFCFDPQNYFKITQHLTHSSNKKKLNDFILNQQK